MNARLAASHQLAADATLPCLNQPAIDPTLVMIITPCGAGARGDAKLEQLSGLKAGEDRAMGARFRLCHRCALHARGKVRP
mmetsp:Transcript_6359/g.20470  ORF Transcript_6359/g.20470 Transcript_6359/m.20470 type:complete len:81 (+) Transcript_6359:301-543(+)